MTEQNPSKLSILDSIKVLLTASRGYLLVNLSNFGDGIAYFGFIGLMVLFMEKNVGFTAHYSTVSISSFSGAVTIFMALGAGALADRLGVRRALTVVWALLLVGRAVFTMSPMGGTVYWSGAIAILGLFLMAAGEGVIQPALYAGVKHYTTEKTKTLGYAFIYAVMNLGIVVGEALSPIIRKWWAANVEGVNILDKGHGGAGIEGSFWFFTGVTLLMLLIHVMFFTKKVEERDRKVEPDEEPESEKIPLMQKVKNLPIWDVRFFSFIFILLPVRTLFAHQFLTMPLFVERAFPASVAAKWEWVYMINPAVIVIFVPLIAALTLKKKVLDMMIVGTLFSALCSFLLCTEPSLTTLLAYMVLFSLGEAVWSSRFLEYIADIAPSKQVGVYMGLATIPWFLAKFTTGLYAGWMLDKFVPATGTQHTGMLWFIYGAIALISPIALLLMRKWLLKGVRNDGVGNEAAEA